MRFQYCKLEVYGPLDFCPVSYLLKTQSSQIPPSPPYQEKTGISGAAFFVEAPLGWSPFHWLVTIPGILRSLPEISFPPQLLLQGAGIRKYFHSLMLQPCSQKYLCGEKQCLQMIINHVANQMVLWDQCQLAIWPE